MDKLRAAAKAVFYDYPLGDLYSLVMDKGKNREKKYLDGIGKLMSVRENTVNISGHHLTAAMLRSGWAKGTHNLAHGTALDRVFYLAAEYAEKTLEESQNALIVKFDELFRWRELSRLMGEELLSLAYLAQKDETARTALCWKNVLDTNNESVADIIKEGACDIHSHLNATYDAFIINWIGLMNQIKGRAKDFDSLENPMDNPVVLRDYQFSDLYSWCIIAARIRVFLYQVFVLGKSEVALLKPFEGLSLLTQVSYYNYIVDDIQSDIDYLRRRAINRYGTDQIIDYAIDIDLGEEQASSPHVIFQGERKMEYSFLHCYFHGKIKNKRTIYLTYLYERIKTELRKELVQTNSKCGLMNFKFYNSHKDIFSRQDEYLKEVKLKYGIQTGLEADGTFLEGRICEADIDRVKKLKCTEAILNKKDTEHEEQKVRYVIHLLKSSTFSKNNRYCEEKRQVWIAEINKILKTIKGNERFVGIDFAGSELYMRPETPAHVIRYAIAHGIENVTYHVGEDFYDIIDGLRAIDEAVRFMGLDRHSRIGHGLAMGIDAKQYYESQGKEIVMPRQVLLDNLVWMMKTSENDILSLIYGSDEKIMARCETLFREIGYKGDFSLDDYYASMMLRGDDEMEFLAGENPHNGYNHWKNTMICRHAGGKDYRRNERAVKLWKEYLLKRDIREKGDEPTLFRVNKRYIRQVERLQSIVRNTVENKGICVEANLTSNILISNLKRYDRHPIRKIRSTSSIFGHHIPVALGTDDKGVFATSLSNEYALLALSMKKQRGWKGRKWSDKQIDDYLRQLAATSIKYRFTRDGIK